MNGGNMMLMRKSFISQTRWLGMLVLVMLSGVQGSYEPEPCLERFQLLRDHPISGFPAEGFMRVDYGEVVLSRNEARTLVPHASSVTIALPEGERPFGISQEAAERTYFLICQDSYDLSPGGQMHNFYSNTVNPDEILVGEFWLQIIDYHRNTRIVQMVIAMEGEPPEGLGGEQSFFLAMRD